MVASIRLIIVLDNGRVLQRRTRHWLKERVVSISVPGMPSQLLVTTLAELATTGHVTVHSLLAGGRSIIHLLLVQRASLRHTLFDLTEVPNWRLSGHRRGKFEVFLLAHLLQVHKPRRSVFVVTAAPSSIVLSHRLPRRGVLGGSVLTEGRELAHSDGRGRVL